VPVLDFGLKMGGVTTYIADCSINFIEMQLKARDFLHVDIVIANHRTSNSGYFDAHRMFYFSECRLQTISVDTFAV